MGIEKEESLARGSSADRFKDGGLRHDVTALCLPKLFQDGFFLPFFVVI